MRVELKPSSLVATISTCGELSKGQEGQDIILNGWIENYRDHGQILFLDISMVWWGSLNLEVGFMVRNARAWNLTLNIPNNPTLAGSTFYNQAWVLDAKANAFGVGTSNRGKGVIGY